MVFLNGSYYDYHFTIKKLAEEFKRQFTCLGENTEKYITFTVPIEKEVIRINKKGKETISKLKILIIFLLIKFIKLNVNTDIITKNVKIVELNKDSDCFFEYRNFKHNKINNKGLLKT